MNRNHEYLNTNANKLPDEVSISSLYDHKHILGENIFIYDQSSGGMGQVYFCYDRIEDYFYALKTFQLRYWNNPKIHNLFYHEVNKWIDLGYHPHIVQCHSLRRINNIPFMFLEWITDDDTLRQNYENQHKDQARFLDWYARLGKRGLHLRRSTVTHSQGISLEGRLKNGPLDLKSALEIALDICDGLAYAGQRIKGFVHRDLKPSNILIDQLHRAKITDFGLAYVVQQSELFLDSSLGNQELNDLESLHQVGKGVGTPPYMPPEQWDGQILDARTDIYAMGCILYKMLTNKTIFSVRLAETTRDQYIELLNWSHHHLSPPGLDGGFPKHLNDIIQTCLEKDPRDRYDSIEHLKNELLSLYLQTLGSAPKSALIDQTYTAEDYNNIAITYDRLGKHTQAFDYYNKAINIDATYPNTYTNRGGTYHRIQEYRLAIEDYNNAIRLGRNSINAVVRNNRGLTYLCLGEYYQAINDFNVAIDIASLYANAYSNRGLAYITLGDLERSLSDYSKSLDINPGLVTSYLNRAYIYHIIGSYEQSLQDYTQAIMLDPTMAKAFANRHIVYGKLHQEDKSKIDKQNALNLGISEHQLTWLSMMLSNIEADKTIPILSLCVQFNDPDINIINIGSIYFTHVKINSYHFSENEGVLQATYDLTSTSERKMICASPVTVKAVSYSDNIHRFIQERQDMGERITQISLEVEYLSEDLEYITTMCDVVLDMDTMKEMEAEDMQSISDLIGCRLILIDEYPATMSAPLRIYNYV